MPFQPKALLPILFATAIAVSAAAPSLAAPTGPAAKDLSRYVAGTRIPCYSNAGEGTCTIASIADTSGIKVFYGQAAGEPEMAVAFIGYQYDSTGNAMDQMAVVMKRDDTRWIPVGRADNTQGTSPRDVRFLPGRITYVGTMLGPNDSRANPTAHKPFALLVGNGKVQFVKGAQGEAMSNRIRAGR
jgi:hypothetical protein